MSSSPRHLIITGIPRAGTTLFTALVDSSENAIGLSEPDWTWELKDQAVNSEDYADAVLAKLTSLRGDVLAGKPVYDHRGQDGTTVTNYFTTTSDGSRKPIAAERPTLRNARNDFLLAVKDNAAFLSALPQFVARKIPIVAIIRNPADVFRSWRSVDLPVSRGRLPAGEKFWPELKAIGHSNNSLPEKHANIFDLICQRLWQNRNGIHLVRYEDLVTSPESALAKLGITDANYDLIGSSRSSGEATPEGDAAFDALRRKAQFAIHFFPVR